MHNFSTKIKLEVSYTTYDNMRLRHDASCITLVKRGPALYDCDLKCPVVNCHRSISDNSSNMLLYSINVNIYAVSIFGCILHLVKNSPAPPGFMKWISYFHGPACYR